MSPYPRAICRCCRVWELGDGSGSPQLLTARAGIKVQNTYISRCHATLGKIPAGPETTLPALLDRRTSHNTQEMKTSRSSTPWPGCLTALPASQQMIHLSRDPAQAGRAETGKFPAPAHFTHMPYCSRTETSKTTALAADSWDGSPRRGKLGGILLEGSPNHVSDRQPRPSFRSGAVLPGRSGAVIE